MAKTQEQKWSPLLVKSRPPSLVVDSFRYPASEDDIRLAVSTHQVTDEGHTDDVDAKLAATRRELRHATRILARDRDHRS